MYSRVTMLYLRPPRTRRTSSRSTSPPSVRFSSCTASPDGVVLPLRNGVFAPLLSCACTSQMPSTRRPGGRRESHDTRNPETMGNRLGERLAGGLGIWQVAHPSCAGHVDKPASTAAQSDSPSSSSTTTGSSKGRISRMSPRVITPEPRNEMVICGEEYSCVPGPYVESPRMVPPQISTPSVPLVWPFKHSESSYACLNTSANQLPEADYYEGKPRLGSTDSGTDLI